MNRHESGPRRPQSIDAYLRPTRGIAVVAPLGSAAGIVSVLLGGTFWVRHALLTSLAASVVVDTLVVAGFRFNRWR